MSERHFVWALALVASVAASWLVLDRLALQRRLAQLAESQERSTRISQELGEHAENLTGSQNAMAIALAQATSNLPHAAASPASANALPSEEVHPEVALELAGNAGNDAYQKTLQSHFDRQNSRSTWPPQNRAGLENALRKLGASQRGIQELECRGTMCRTSIPFAGRDDAMAFMQQLPQTQNGGWEGAVAANVVSAPDGAVTVIFYATPPGTNLPAPGD
jgi:hypothetical protein